MPIAVGRFERDWLIEMWKRGLAAVAESPVFRMMAGVGELADKDEDDFTREDVRKRRRPSHETM